MGRRNADRGLSLIEVVVALVIVLVISGFAVSRFSGTTTAVTDRAAQADLAAMEMVQADVFSALGGFTDNAGVLENAGFGIDVVESNVSASGRAVSVARVDSGLGFAAAAEGGDGACWIVVKHVRPTASERNVLYAIDVDGAPTCTGDNAAAFVSTATAATGEGTSFEAPASVELP